MYVCLILFIKVAFCFFVWTYVDARLACIQLVDLYGSQRPQNMEKKESNDREKENDILEIEERNEKEEAKTRLLTAVMYLLAAIKLGNQLTMITKNSLVLCSDPSFSVPANLSTGRRLQKVFISIVSFTPY